MGNPPNLNNALILQIATSLGICWKNQEMLQKIEGVVSTIYDAFVDSSYSLGEDSSWNPNPGCLGGTIEAMLHEEIGPVVRKLERQVNEYRDEAEKARTSYTMEVAANQDLNEVLQKKQDEIQSLLNRVRFLEEKNRKT